MVDVGPLRLDASGAEEQRAVAGGVAVVLDITARRRADAARGAPGGRLRGGLRARARRDRPARPRRSLAAGQPRAVRDHRLHRRRADRQALRRHHAPGRRAATTRAERERLLAGEIPAFQVEKRYFDAAGETVSAILSMSLVRDRDGAPLHYIAQLQDISERKQLEEQLRHLADHDPLTGLRNRRLFEHDLQPAGRPLPALRRARRPDGDRPRRLQGHQRQPTATAPATRRCRRSRARSPAGCAKPTWWRALGGDEFAVLLPHIDEEGAGGRRRGPRARDPGLQHRRRRRRRCTPAQHRLHAHRRAQRRAPSRRSSTPTGRCTRPSAPSAASRAEPARTERLAGAAAAEPSGAVEYAHGDAAERAARGDRPRLELVPAGRVHGRRGLVEAHRRDLRAGADRRGPDGQRAAGRGADASARWRRSTCSRTSAARAGWSGDAVDAVATSAIRDAENAESFLERGARALRAADPRAQPRGRGALRLPRGGQLDDARATAACSTSAAARCSSCASPSGWRASPAPGALGTVRMSERFLPPNGPAKRRQLEELREHVAARARATRLARRRGRARAAGAWSGIGGTVRNLAAAAQRAAGLPSNGVQGMVIERDALDELVERARGAAGGRARERARDQARARRPDPRRRGGRAGCAAGGRLRRARDDRGGPARGRVLRAAARGHWPAASAAAVRGRAPRERAEHGRRSTASTSSTPRHVAALALGMFDELARLGLHDGDPRERELLWAACMLHDIGMSIDYDDHHKHSRYLILNGGLPGFTPVETAIIAQAARYHRKGMPVPGPMAALFGDGRRRAPGPLRGAAAPGRGPRALARPARAQHQRSRSATARCELRLIADGESAVPRWAAGRERELFARAFHRDLSVAA